MSETPASYGTPKGRGASVSFADIERAARGLMAVGQVPTAAAVRGVLKRGSNTTLTEAMRRFWQNQAALNAGEPLALTRLPPEVAEAAVALWEKALRLSLQTATHQLKAVHGALDTERSDVKMRLHALEIREKDWDLAARIREKALEEARSQILQLTEALGAVRQELRSRDTQISDLTAQMKAQHDQLTLLITRAVVNSRRAAARRVVAAPGAKRSAPRRRVPLRGRPTRVTARTRISKRPKTPKQKRGYK